MASTNGLPPDAFELQVLDQQDPQVDVSTLQDAVKGIREDIDMIIEHRVPKFEALFAEPTEVKEMASLFAVFEIPPPPP